MGNKLSITDQLTALEVVNRQGGSPDGRRIIEVLTTVNELLIDAPILPANDRTVNRAVQRTSLPHAEHRIYNQGVGKGSSQTKPIVDVICSMAIYSVVDAKLVRESADPQGLLSSENEAFIEGMGQDQADDFIYGDHSANPAQMDGFARRRNKIGRECISMGGSNNGHMTSVYLCKWHKNKMHLIYPKGASDVGVKREDRGKQDWDDGSGKKYPAHVSYYESEYGLAVKDDRALIRICNIDMATFDAAAAKTLLEKIIVANSKLAPGDGTVCLYANREVLSQFDIATLHENSVIRTYADPWGKEITGIRNIRFRQQDAILNTEDTVEA